MNGMTNIVYVYVCIIFICYSFRICQGTVTMCDYKSNSDIIISHLKEKRRKKIENKFFHYLFKYLGRGRKRKLANKIRIIKQNIIHFDSI